MKTVVELLNYDLTPYLGSNSEPQKIDAGLFERVLILKRDEQKFIRDTRQVWRLWFHNTYFSVIRRVVLVDGQYFYIVHGTFRDNDLVTEYIGHFLTEPEALVISVISM